jgi:hypothetical protein
VATDVIEIVLPPFSPPGELAGVIPDRNGKRYATIMGGMPIRNANVGEDHVGVLGAVVFDNKNGAAMGLSVQHAIGNQVPDKRAAPGDPINHPLTYPPKKADQIGQLVKFDEDFDAALFQIDGPRKCEAKMLAIDDTAFEPSEASPARIGQEAECPGRRTHTNGTVCWCLSHRQRGKSIRTVVIKFSDGYTPTFSGDSGAVWVSTKSRSPIALHRGTWTIVLPNGRESVAYATCMKQLTGWGEFRITPPGEAAIANELSGYEASFVQKGGDVFVFCDKPGTADRLLVKKYDRDLNFVEDKENAIFPMSGVTAVRFNEHVYAAWRSGNAEQIQIAKLKPSSIELEPPITLKIRTLRKPVMVQFEDKIYLMYTDADTQRLSVVYSAEPSSNTSWRRYEISNVKSRVAPAATWFKDAVYLCWIDLNNRIRIGKSSGRNVSFYTSLDPKMTCYDPAMTVFEGKLCVAYTTLTGELRIVETSDLWRWSIRRSDSEKRLAAPSLFAAENRLVCFR